MVRPDLKGIRMALEIVAESFEGTNDGKEFFVVDVIIELRQLH